MTAEGPERPGLPEAAGAPAPNAAAIRPRLRSHLIALVLAAVVPALAFGAVAAADALRRRDAEIEARLADTARALAATVDAQIAARISALQVLAAAPDATGPEGREHLEEHARRTGKIFGAWVSVVEPDGRALINTVLPEGVAPRGQAGGIGPGGGGKAIARAVATGAPAVGDLALGRSSNELTAFVYVPALRDGQVRLVFGMPLLPAQLSAMLAGQASGSDGIVTLTDSRGVFVARSREVDRVIGQYRPARSDAGPVGLGGVLHGRRLVEGAEIRAGYHRLATAPGWHVWVSEPDSSFLASHLGPLLALLAGTTVAVGIGLLAAVALSRRLLRPVDALVSHAEAVASGNVRGDEPVIRTSPAPVAEFERLRRAVAGAESALRRVQRIGRVGGFEIDLRTGENFRSAEYMTLHGRPLTPAEERHEDWVRRLHPEDRERAETRFLDAISDESGETDYAQEYRIFTPDGQLRWIYARAEIERDANGHAVRMVGAHVDVTALKVAEAALRDSEERLRLALEAAQLGAWEVDYTTGEAKRTRRALEIFGYGTDHATAIYPAWRDRVHADDRPRLAAAVDAVRLGRRDSYRIEYRFLRPDGRWIWIESHARAAGADPVTGKAARLIGTSQDITARKEAEENQAVLVHELDHRAKNTLAVVQAALRLTPRSDPAAFAEAVVGRVNALARAHTLLAKGRWHGAELRAVAEDALAPFLGEEGPRAEFAGPPMQLSPGAVQALSMAFHELATNAAKHGALSVHSGGVALRWEVVGKELRIAWTEAGGPLVTEEPARRGFGSSLIRATVQRQLGGRIHSEWRPGGLFLEAWLPLDRLQAAGGAELPVTLPTVPLPEPEPAGGAPAAEPAPAT